MTDSRRIVVARLEPPETGGAPTPWSGSEVRADRAPACGKRILLVDDEDSLRACLRLMLELAGYRVTEARDGVEALKIFAVGEFDLVITDFNMPVMQGNELAVKLKLLAPSQPILMITASPRARSEPQNPVDALLNKPFLVAELHHALGKLLSPGVEPARPQFVAAPRTPAVAVAIAPEREREMAASLPG